MLFSALLALATLHMNAVVQLTPPTAYDYQQVQMTARGRTVMATFGWGNRVLFTRSRDAGKTFSPPHAVAEPGVLSLGMHRGPRIALAGQTFVVTAIAGAKGKGADGDLLAYRSSDEGATWAGPVRVNDVSGSAREGLHSMAGGPNGILFAAWLDLRKPGTRLYGAASYDGGKTWSANVEIYVSPSGTICQCCHPSVAISSSGAITVMWRNAVSGNRDLYLAESTDGGRTFSSGEKLGVGSWKLDACPMDGGALALDANGKPVTLWRRESTLFLASLNGVEREFQAGKNPTLAYGREGLFAAWSGPRGVELRVPGKLESGLLDPEGSYPQLLALSDGQVLAGWEHKGQIRFQTVTALETESPR